MQANKTTASWPRSPHASRSLILWGVASAAVGVGSGCLAAWSKEAYYNDPGAGPYSAINGISASTTYVMGATTIGLLTGAVVIHRW